MMTPVLIWMAARRKKATVTRTVESSKFRREHGGDQFEVMVRLLRKRNVTHVLGPRGDF